MPHRAEPQDDRIVVVTDEGRRSTSPIMELQATRRTPRLEIRADALPVHNVLRVIERARRAAEGCAIANDLTTEPLGSADPKHGGGPVHRRRSVRGTSGVVRRWQRVGRLAMP